MNAPCLIPPPATAETTSEDPLASSLARLLAQPDCFGRALRAHLFSLAPELRPMFGEDVATHGLRLLHAFHALMGCRSDAPRFDALCAELAARHRGYGLNEAHFDLIGTALLSCLRELLDEDFDEATQNAWAGLYGEIAETLIATGLCQL